MTVYVNKKHVGYINIHFMDKIYSSGIIRGECETPVDKISILNVIKTILNGKIKISSSIIVIIDINNTHKLF